MTIHESNRVLIRFQQYNSMAAGKDVTEKDSDQQRLLQVSSPQCTNELEQYKR